MKLGSKTSMVPSLQENVPKATPRLSGTNHQEQSLLRPRKRIRLPAVWRKPLLMPGNTRLAVQLTEERSRNMVEILLGAFLAALLGGLTSLYVARWQMKGGANQARVAYLHNLREELEYNKKVAYEIRTYLVDGPDLEHLFFPATVSATHLQTTAWGDLVRAGVLTDLCVGDRTSFRITDRVVKNLHKAIEVHSANLLRIREWEAHDVETHNPQPASIKLFLPRAVNEMRQASDYAIERISETLARLDEVLNVSKENG